MALTRPLENKQIRQELYRDMLRKPSIKRLLVSGISQTQVILSLALRNILTDKTVKLRRDIRTGRPP